MRFTTGYTFGTRVPGSVATNRQAVEAALKAEGFGVLTEIDIAATLKTKLDLDLAPYLILGACNPPLASRALAADPSIGTLLPCNIVLRADGGDTIVEAMDPIAALSLTDVPGVRPVAEEAKARLERVIASLAGDS